MKIVASLKFTSMESVYKKIIHCIVFQLVFPLVFCTNQYCLNKLSVKFNVSDENSEVTEDRHMPSFDSYSNKHILDPEDFNDVNNITSDELNIIIDQRAILQHTISPGGIDLRRKLYNIFVIGTREEVKASFHRGPSPSIFNESNPITTVGISDKRFPIVGLRKRRHDIRLTFSAWNCGLNYVVSGLNKHNEPLYLNGIQNSSFLFFPFPTIPVLTWKECSRIP